jgi:RNA polymerase sigma-70 factor, ECF subfamily
MLPCGCLSPRGQGDKSLDQSAALNRFLAQVERRAFGMARMASGNPDDALDIVQDTMLHFARLYTNRPEGEWNVLFYKILHSRITDWYRRTAVRRRFHDWFGKSRDDEGDEEDPMARVADSTSPDPAEGVMRQEFTGALQAALRKLPLRQQQAFVLRAWEGFDTAQTAQAMGCSEGSVKTHYSRAVHTLQLKLEEFQP